MSKELEALHTLCKYIEVEFNSDEYYVCKEAKKFIGNALQRLEQIDNSKPSEALEDLEMLHDCSTAMQELPSSNWVEYAENEAELDLKLYFGYEHIKQALLELKAIKEANPSEALEWLDKSKNMMIENNGDFIAFDCLKVYSVLKKALIKAQEQEKVIEIIFEKNVDAKLLKISKTWLDYYTRVKHKTGCNTELTEEEFDLLKRYCDDEIRKEN